MKKCEKCGKYIEDSATYCSYCGTKYGTKGSDNNKKNKNKVNYYGILALIIAVVPTLFSQILINISSLFSTDNIGQIMNSSYGNAIAIVFLLTIILGLVFSIVGFVFSFKEGGFILSILSFLILVVLFISIFISKENGKTFLEQIKMFLEAKYL